MCAARVTPNTVLVVVVVVCVCVSVCVSVCSRSSKGVAQFYAKITIPKKKRLSWFSTRDFLLIATEYSLTAATVYSIAATLSTVFGRQSLLKLCYTT